MLEIWQLVFIITLSAGPTKNAQNVVQKYPQYEIAFEPPSDWIGCYNQKQLMLPIVQKRELAKNPTAKVTASCKRTTIIK